MSTTDNLRDDIAYVRAAAERAGAGSIPSIYVLWAVIGLCGFALADFAADSRSVGLYWMVAWPAGFVVSAWLGYRAGRQSGQGSRRAGVRWAVHWLAFMAGVALGAALGIFLGRAGPDLFLLSTRGCTWTARCWRSAWCWARASW
jgi:hypothetical protein